jgi:hypothetical protein
MILPTGQQGFLGQKVVIPTEYEYEFLGYKTVLPREQNKEFLGCTSQERI